MHTDSTSGCAGTARHRSSMTERAVIRELLSYRLHTVANLLSRGAELRYRREFGVSLWEWRSVALLGGAGGPLSLSELARAAGIDKGQMSRVVSGLAKRGIVVRQADSADGRGVRLALSKPGRRLYAGLIRAAAQRDTAFNACLSGREKQVFEKVLHKLAAAARDMIQQEKRG
jgi:DNA-binding MarR family transcriptional regulator